MYTLNINNIQMCIHSTCNQIAASDWLKEREKYVPELRTAGTIHLKVSDTSFLLFSCLNTSINNILLYHTCMPAFWLNCASKTSGNVSVKYFQTKLAIDDMIYLNFTFSYHHNAE